MSAYEIFRYFQEIVKMNFKNIDNYEPIELFLEDNQENLRVHMIIRKDFNMDNKYLL